MWYPKDAATWLALVALILVIPFNFFSSWAFPKLQNWWAARSRKSLQKRIHKLKTLLAQMNERRAMPLRDELVLMCAEQLGWLVFASVITVVMINILFLDPAMKAAHRNKLAFAISIILVAYKSLKDYLMIDIRGFRRFSGTIVKLDLERSLERLEAKLAAHKPINLPPRGLR